MKKFVLKARLEYWYIEHGLKLYHLQNDLTFPITQIQGIANKKYTKIDLHKATIKKNVCQPFRYDYFSAPPSSCTENAWRQRNWLKSLILRTMHWKTLLSM